MHTDLPIYYIVNAAPIENIIPVSNDKKYSDFVCI